MLDPQHLRTLWASTTSYMDSFTYKISHMPIQNLYTVDSRLSAVMVGRIGADNQNQRINRSTHTQARYTGIKLTGA
jgi:hypothetical protein